MFFSQAKDINLLKAIIKNDAEDSSKIFHLIKLSNKYNSISLDSAILFAEHALKVANTIDAGNRDRLIALSSNNLGTIYFNQAKYLKAFEYKINALKIAEKINDKKILHDCYSALGAIFYIQKDYTKSQSHYFNALKIDAKLNDKKQMAQTLNSIGSLYEVQCNNTEAITYYQKALNLYQELNIKSGIAACISNIANIYSHQGNYEKATDYYFKALTIDEEINSKAGIACDKLHIGSFYLKTKKYKEAEAYLLQSLSLSDSLGDLIYQQEAFAYLSNLYAQINNYQKAMVYQQKNAVAKDSLFKEEQMKEFARIEMNFDFEKKELQLKAEANRKKIITTSIIIILGILLIAIVILLYQQKLKRKKEKIIFEKENEVLKLEKNNLELELLNSKKLLNIYVENMLEKSEIVEKYSLEIEELKQLKTKELTEIRTEQIDELNNVKILTDEDWNKFQELFEGVHKGFIIRLKEKIPNLTQAEIRLICLTKLNLTTKQMADMLGVSQDTIKKTRYRLRKKLVISQENDIDELAKTI